MRLKIRHQTNYHYDSPVQYALQQIRLQPVDRPGREVLEWNLAIEGGQREVSFRDQHDNHVDLVRIDPGRSEVVITSEGIVETADNAGVTGNHAGFAPLWLFNRPTELTRPGPKLRKLIRGLDDDFETDIASLHALSARIIETVRYETDRTHAETTVEEALESGHGVCQDHAHIFIAAARLMGFPARYVSGYLMMHDEDIIEQDASHAWAEAHLDGIGWIGFDVSNGISPDDHYVAIATGLDYKEAAPISGLRFGDSAESMVVTLQVEQ